MKRFLRIILAILSVILIAGSSRAVSAAAEPGSFMEVYFNNPYAAQRDTTLQDRIIEAINAANDHVYLATYNFTDKKVAEAARLTTIFRATISKTYRRSYRVR